MQFEPVNPLSKYGAAPERVHLWQNGSGLTKDKQFLTNSWYRFFHKNFVVLHLLKMFSGRKFVITKAHNSTLS